MVKICVVEDDNGTAETIEAYIKKYFSQDETEVTVTRFADARPFLKNYDESVDVVFMDIDLPGLNGMDAVKELRKNDEEVAVIFVTNLAQFAVSGYSVSAFDFIVKPISYGSFAMKLRRLSQYLAARRKCEICVSTRNGKILVKASDIKYVEIMRHMLTYHTESGTVMGSGTLKNVTDMLEGLPFVMCNRCYLVNLSYVTRIIGNDVFVGGDKLQISAPRRKDFFTAFNKHLGAGGKVK